MQNEEILSRLGAAIRERRMQLELSQEELAERAQLHRNYIGGIERGERNVAVINLQRIAAALEMSVSELVKVLD